MRNVLTIDIEEYFHPTEVQAAVGMELWDTLPSRIEDETKRVLELLGARGTKATFFVLGWVADRHPALLREIAAAGHELGCHGYSHRLVYDLSPGQFEKDTRRASLAIAGACGVLPRAYRAASYSITARSLWALEVLAECGFTHDSSIYPIAHDRYGIPGHSRHAQIVRTPAGPIVEVPIATVRLRDERFAPVGGGAYLRLLPYRYTAAGIRKINEEEQQPACIYFHPWELDAGQPHLARGLLSSLRTYSGIARMPSKIARLLADFEFGPLSAAHALPPDRAGEPHAATMTAVA